MVSPTELSARFSAVDAETVMRRYNDYGVVIIPYSLREYGVSDGIQRPIFCGGRTLTGIPLSYDVTNGIVCLDYAV